MGWEGDSRRAHLAVVRFSGTAGRLHPEGMAAKTRGREGEPRCPGAGGKLLAQHRADLGVPGAGRVAAWSGWRDWVWERRTMRWRGQVLTLTPLGRCRLDFEWGLPRVGSRGGMWSD